VGWIAARSPVNIVVVTGHHQDRYAAPYLGQRDVEAIAESMVRELREGIGETGVKAGLITVGTSRDQITPIEERVLRAAAWAHAETGAPISTHIESGTMALEQLAILRREGVEPSRVIVGHLDRRLDEDYLRRVLATGAFVSFDQISKTDDGADDARAAMVRLLVALGYRDQLLLSGDLARKSMQTAYGGTPGWTYLVEGFPLMLMDEGVPAPVIRQIFVDNPARALAIVP
jgi:phosphotriesterase-related protein